MDQKSTIQEEGLGEVIDIVKDLIAKTDDKMGCATGARMANHPANQLHQLLPDKWTAR